MLVRLKGPMFSLEAHGAIGKTVIMELWEGVSYAKKWAKPCNPRSAAQRLLRGYFAYCITHSRALTPYQVYWWQGWLGEAGTTWFNRATGRGLSFELERLAPPLYPPTYDIVNPPAPTDLWYDWGTQTLSWDYVHGAQVVAYIVSRALYYPGPWDAAHRYNWTCGNSMVVPGGPGVYAVVQAEDEAGNLSAVSVCLELVEMFLGAGDGMGAVRSTHGILGEADAHSSRGEVV